MLLRVVRVVVKYRMLLWFGMLTNHTKTVTARKENESKKIATTVTITAVAIYKTLLINKIYEQSRLYPYPARM